MPLWAHVDMSESFEQVYTSVFPDFHMRGRRRAILRRSYGADSRRLCDFSSYSRIHLDFRTHLLTVPHLH